MLNIFFLIYVQCIVFKYSSTNFFKKCYERLFSLIGNNTNYVMDIEDASQTKIGTDEIPQSSQIRRSKRKLK